MIEKPYLAKSNGIKFRNFGHKQGIQVRRRNFCLGPNLYKEFGDAGVFSIHPRCKKLISFSWAIDSELRTCSWEQCSKAPNTPNLRKSSYRNIMSICIV